jgi:hypothetical protein
MRFRGALAAPFARTSMVSGVALPVDGGYTIV